MRVKNLMLFVYDFPHKKSQEFLLRLWTEGYNILYVIAAPYQKLSIAPPAIRSSAKNEGLIHPRTLCKKMGIRYLVSEHNSQKTINYLKKYPVDLAVIAGARILSQDVINALDKKILNIHPGLLPQARGLDTLLWSINNNVPLGITSHFIDSKIDAGILVYKEQLELKKDDTLIDVSLRLLEKQTDVLLTSLKVLSKKKMTQLKSLNLEKNNYNTKMNSQKELEVVKQFDSWLKKYAKK